MTKAFIIIKVGWLTNTPGYGDMRDEIIDHVYSIAKFLQKNKLTQKPLISNRSEIDDEFSISSDDLTEEGLSLMKLSYDKWLRKVDRGMSPQNTTLLEKTLRKIRNT